jgi:hypothetical protein
VLENQLFAPVLKGVIDFDCVELALRARFFAPFRDGADEENQKINERIWKLINLSVCEVPEYIFKVALFLLK